MLSAGTPPTPAIGWQCRAERVGDLRMGQDAPSAVGAFSLGRGDKVTGGPFPDTTKRAVSIARKYQDDRAYAPCHRQLPERPEPIPTLSQSQIRAKL